MNRFEPRKTSLMLDERDRERLRELLGSNTSEKIRNAIRIAYYVHRKTESIPMDVPSIELDLDALRALK